MRNIKNKSKSGVAKDKREIVVGFIVAALVLATTVLYVTNMGSINLSEYSTILIIIVLVIGATWVLVDRMRNVKAGLPAKDEMTVRLMHKSGYYAFLASIYIALALMLSSDFLEESNGAGLDAGQIGGGIILLSAIVFMGSYFYLSHKGAAE
ncbi:MAG: hypothetical protein Sv326_0719 [Candidatus Fermentimicrarchaeum limneticum]|uniref:DUF2178 domain-containing protein n=1 Tax=Fermentimicrarchaeum limneticum TaxID=2795018 RepID=A0A7D5XI66_FERL1|nr:MAG: hypothetical protein Sv326_0719 [Candidatus Fermentimicrarchaeum limneticum]